VNPATFIFLSLLAPWYRPVATLDRVSLSIHRAVLRWCFGQRLSICSSSVEKKELSVDIIDVKEEATEREAI
jgi:hypothetical protein